MAYNFKKSDITRAIADSGGIMSVVAKRLRCDWATARKYVKRYDLYELLGEEKEQLLDFTESKLIDNIKNGDQRAIEFFLTTQGRARGYGAENQQQINVGVCVLGGEENAKLGQAVKPLELPAPKVLLNE